jgi:uncharacterized protein YggE
MRFFAISLLCVISSPCLAQTDEAPKRGVFIVSEGAVRLPPEIATIQAGVVTEGKTAEEALSKNRPAMNRVVEVVRKYGVVSADVTTSELRLNPKFTQPPAASPGGPRPAAVIDGYEARTSLKIVVRDLAKTGPLVDDLVKSGSNSISNLTFGLTEPGKAKDAAGRKAAEAARSRAALYAEAVGVELGPLISITESEFNPEPLGEADLPARRNIPGVAPTVIEPGEIEVRAAVKTVWQIGK